MGKYFEVSEYTAEDFARANLATRGTGELARRADPEGWLQWLCSDGDNGEWWRGDESMAADGWVPVLVESRITEHTLRDSQEKAERKRQKLVDHIEDLNAAMRRKNERIKLQNAKLAAAEARIKELRRENRRLDAEADGAISLDGLRAAWEAAEVPTGENPIREGDVVIYRHDGGQWAVREVEPHEHDDDDWSCTVRVLSRAPKRAPWQDLADAFKTWDYPVRGYEEELAKWVYANGVRVAGGDDDE